MASDHAVGPSKLKLGHASLMVDCSPQRQVVFSHLNFSALGATADYDAWDGYKANRQRILDHVQDNKIDNL